MLVLKEKQMNNLFRGLLAGWGAKKLGTGCFSTIIIFILIWVALGQCEGSSFGVKHRHNQEKLQKAENKMLAVHIPAAKKDA
jgi:hypothetical protein